MYRDNPKLAEQAYQPEHIAEVLADMRSNLPRYFVTLATGQTSLAERLAASVADFENEQPHYQELFDLGMLEEYAYDPNAFKGDFRRKCPIVRRCLMSPAKVMDNYRAAFNLTDGARMLEVTTNIVKFAHEFMQSFDDSQHELAQSPADLGVDTLDEETFTAYGVIGGGIRSHFLHQLYPYVFPNRSQSAIWAYYFLTERKDYGFDDGSEFLMIEPEGAQQNYFYPYNLFSYYALQLYLALRDACAGHGVSLERAYRYVYLDAFLAHIADTHREDINYLKPQHEQIYY